MWKAIIIQIIPRGGWIRELIPVLGAESLREHRIGRTNRHMQVSMIFYDYYLQIKNEAHSNNKLLVKQGEIPRLAT